MWVKGTFVILFALCIDALQALISLGVSVIAVFPGIFGGAVGGCLLAQKAVTGTVSCAVGGFVLGTLGSIPIVNAALATVTIPLGILLAFIIDVCLSLTMGAGLIAILWMFGMFYPGYVTAVFIGEALPGLDIVPGWTFLAIRSVMKKAAAESHGVGALAAGVASAVLSPSGEVGALGTVARGISNIKSTTGDLVRTSSLVREAYDSETTEERAQLSSNVRRELPVRSPSIQTDIISREPANDNFQPYVQKAA